MRDARTRIMPSPSAEVQSLALEEPTGRVMVAAGMPAFGMPAVRWPNERASEKSPPFQLPDDLGFSR